MLPLAGAGAVTVPLMVRLKSRRSSDPWRVKVARVDLVGAGLFISSATLVLIALSRAGIQAPWSSAMTVGPLVGGSLGLVITVFWERFVATTPFLKFALFHRKSAYGVYAGTFAQGFLVSDLPLFSRSI